MQAQKDGVTLSSQTWWLAPEIVFQEAMRLFREHHVVSIHFAAETNTWEIKSDNTVLLKLNL